MKRTFFVLLLLAAGTALRAQTLGGEYRLSRVFPVEGRQGIAADSNYYYVSGSTVLYKYDKQGRLVARNGQPFEGLPLAANHIGDIDVWNGEIYAGIETFDDGKGENIQVDVEAVDRLGTGLGAGRGVRAGRRPRPEYGLDGRLGRRALPVRL